MKHLGVLKNLIKNDSVLLLKLEFGGVFSVPDSDLETRGEGSSRPLDKGGGAVSKKKFSALWTSVWFKDKAPHSPGSATGFSCLREKNKSQTPKQKPLSAKRGTNTNSTHNPGYICGRRMLSTLRHPSLIESVI